MSTDADTTSSPGDDSADPHTPVGPRLDSEEAVKRGTHIDSFDNLSNSDVLTLAAALPDMSDEVRIKLIEQIPALQQFALEAITAVQQVHEKTIDSTDDSRRDLSESFADVRSFIKQIGERDAISPEHLLLIDKAAETVKLQAEVHREDRKFKADEAKEARKAILLGVGIAVLTSVVMAGGKVFLDSRLGGNDLA